MRDFYLSKINKQNITPDKAEGFVRLAVSEEENLRVQYQKSGEGQHYGVSPIRLQNNVFETENETLRAPNLRQPLSTQRKQASFLSPAQKTKHNQGSEITMSVIDLLSQQESFDIGFI